MLPWLFSGQFRMTGLIDTHCHLDAPVFAGQQAAIWGAAQAAGVTQLLIPATTLATFPATRQAAQAVGAWVAYGLHPLFIDQHQPAHLDQLDDWLTRERPQAVGEIGLDFYLPPPDTARQEALFAAQLALARRHDLPVIVHCRRAQDCVLKYLRRAKVKGGIAHAFNGSRQQAEAFIALGFKLGFGGTMTFEGSRRIRALAASLPLSAIVLETDAPDMRPAWAQDKQNVPANLSHFAEILAALRHAPLAHIIAATTKNARTIFGQ